MPSTLLQDILNAKPALNLLSRTKLTAALRQQGVSKSDVDAHFRPKEIDQIFAPYKKLQPLKITAEPYTFQMDIALLPAYKSQNGGVDKMLVLIDIISKKAYCYPLKSGSMVSVGLVFVKFFQDLVRNEDIIMTGVQADDAFNNPQFKKTCEDLQVSLVTGVAKDDHIVRNHGDKLGIVDRFVRTIKLYIQKYMLIHKDLHWTVWLSQLVDLYNDTPHVGLKGADGSTTPNEVFDDADYANALHKGSQRHNRAVAMSFDIHVGDTVRRLMGRQVFDKEKPRYSTDIYEVIKQDGYRFRLQDEAGGKVLRLYRPSELLKVNGVVDERLHASNEKINEAKDNHESILRIQRGTVDKTYKEAEALKAQMIRPKSTTSNATTTQPPRKSTRNRKAIEKLNL